MCKHLYFLILDIQLLPYAKITKIIKNQVRKIK